jgi:hypothetical protein
VPPVRALPAFSEARGRTGAQPIIPEVADGAAQPRLKSGGRAELIVELTFRAKPHHDRN